MQLGQRVGAGEIIADGAATDGGELALGSNVLVAFMPWYGHNFEDAIVLSERLVKDDVYSSIHIQELELHVRDTKRGQEEITREIPNVSDESVVDLDERGIVRIGAHVKPGDILVGKITPKGETELSPEEKLLTAIFGEKAKDVKDSSLKVPPGMAGVVIDVKIFSRIEDQVVEKDRGERIGEVRRIENDEKARINTVMLDELRHLLQGQEVALMLKAGTVEEYLPSGTKLTAASLQDVDLGDVDLKTLRVANKTANERIRSAIDMAARERAKVEEKAEDQIDKILQPDELPPGVIQLVKVYIAEKRKISVGDKMAGRHGNKGIVARIVPEEDMPFLPDGTPVDIVLNPLGVPSRMNVGQILETHLGWAARILGLRGQDARSSGARTRPRSACCCGWRGSAGRRRASGCAARPPAAGARGDHPDGAGPQEGRAGGRAHHRCSRPAPALLGATGRLGRDQGAVPGRSAAFLADAAKELGERELAQRRQEVAFHQVGRGRRRRREGGRQGAEGAGEGGGRQPGRGAGGRRASRRWRRCSAARATRTWMRRRTSCSATAGLTPAGKARLRDGRTGQPSRATSRSARSTC